MCLNDKLCRILFALLLCCGGLCVQAGPAAKWHNADARRLGARDTAPAASRSYLQLALSPQVRYEADAGERPPAVGSKALAQASLSYSDFVEQMEERALAAEKPEPSEGPEQAAAAVSIEDAPQPDAVDWSHSGPNTTQASAESSTAAAAASGVQVTVNVGEAPLFRRDFGDADEFSKLMMFFPAVETNTDGLGGYNILTPVDRFDLFTPPSQNLPKSTARYQVVP
jgi:hypothetical protein